MIEYITLGIATIAAIVIIVTVKSVLKSNDDIDFDLDTKKGKVKIKKTKRKPY